MYVNSYCWAICEFAVMSHMWSQKHDIAVTSLWCFYYDLTFVTCLWYHCDIVVISLLDWVHIILLHLFYSCMVFWYMANITHGIYPCYWLINVKSFLRFVPGSYNIIHAIIMLLLSSHKEWVQISSYVYVMALSHEPILQRITRRLGSFPTAAYSNRIPSDVNVRITYEELLGRVLYLYKTCA